MITVKLHFLPLSFFLLLVPLYLDSIALLPIMNLTPIEDATSTRPQEEKKQRCTFHIMPDNPRRPYRSVTELSSTAFIPALSRMTSAKGSLKKKTNINRWSGVPVDKGSISQVNCYEYESTETASTVSPDFSPIGTVPSRVTPRKPTRKATMEFVPREALPTHTTAEGSRVARTYYSGAETKLHLQGCCPKKPTRKASMDMSAAVHGYMDNMTLCCSKPTRKASMDMSSIVDDYNNNNMTLSKLDSTKSSSSPQTITAKSLLRDARGARQTTNTTPSSTASRIKPYSRIKVSH
jgi:hypothetical protein